ncbi:YggT family protein [Phosphitispora fastidiosa]|uniref:YggT family protein n=1 Tax=Phosphitispora fastidiosa TaxID=2837202 RepID=UPI001E4E1A13|nr:YggT family protein [Phosphitispora fastidiosa]MBU7008588.1 YggT family protein [Phosphitispora fastidiosa]
MIWLVVDVMFDVIRWLVIARIILSFIPMFTRIDPYHPLIRFVMEITEPLMAPFRRLIPPVGGLDLSPIVLFLVLEFARTLVKQLIFMLFY